MNRDVALAITGASGAAYGLGLCRELLRNGFHLNMMISKPGFTVLETECGLRWSGEPEQVAIRLHRHFQATPEQLSYYAFDNFSAPLASGSSSSGAMVICPCSMGTLARIAAGISANLIERAADVMIKEGRQLVLVPRETPLSAIHLENMLKLARQGVRIIPAMPGFYGQSATVDDMVNFMVGKVLDTLGVKHDLTKRWGDL